MDWNLVFWSQKWESERSKRGNISWVTHLAFTFQGISQNQSEREKERHGDKALMEQRCFTEFCKSIYIPVASLDKCQETRLYKFTKETRSNRCHKAKRQSITKFSSVQSLSHIRLFATPWITAPQASLSITNSQSLLKSKSIESVILSNHLVLCCPLLLLPPIPPSSRVFSNESTPCMRWQKYWRFSFNISPSNEHPGLISFRMDWVDLLAVQGNLKSLFQYHSSKASIFRCSAFFTVQLSHPYMTTGKTTALTRWTFAGKVMSQSNI